MENHISHKRSNIEHKAKQLTDWNKVKIHLHERKRDHKPFREGEIRWLACGENVGTEINGKGKIYVRPVLILKRLDSHAVVGIPMTTQQKDGSWYIKVKFHGREIRAVISQIRIFSTKRLYNRIGRLDEQDVKNIKKGLAKLLDL